MIDNDQSEKPSGIDKTYTNRIGSRDQIIILGKVAPGI